MRPDRAFPVPPLSRRLPDPARPLRRFLLKRALLRLLAALGLRRDGPGRYTSRALAHLDDRLLRDVGLRREQGPQGERYRKL
ncbi:DUF1127 domain-containing protein [Salinarimonas rosea]|uniref:DUF1127 domain-containing protein n=1 Tax=Salinarimonas rosea TaxID=552063 RepID=UPI000410CE18|nr:DUF1127 domain-containing protein [Salinarimonas rosea]